MAPTSPSVALGAHAVAALDLVVETVRARHEYAAAAHAVSHTRYGFGFGGQWKDLLDDTADAFTERGYGLHTLKPAGHRLPIVNNSLIYVWRVPEKPNALRDFAQGATRLSSFFVEYTPDLFGPSYIDGGEQLHDAEEQAEFERALRAAGEAMPVVLVLVHSMPRQLTAIEWAVAQHVPGDVILLGKASIWSTGSDDAEATDVTESFDAGIVDTARLELRPQVRPSDD
ncbi:hypothetical protein [Pseudoclavibacter helvolus]|uniref:hypothetical protein n=1 Tax=Pseudoclavibacter helvolus TaxID=255205 RepID=UPI0024AD333B|nr:hypothetical protein [Pseudoclavibacter helvolus]